MAAENTRDTQEHTQVQSVETATEGVIVRAHSPIGVAHTHTEPGDQRGGREEVIDVALAVGHLGGRGIPQRELDKLLHHERARRLVKRILDAEERPLTPMPPMLSLRERFATVSLQVEYRIDGWFVEGGHVVLVAQYKSGKTTLLGNLVRSLVDGAPFLGMATVRPVESVVMLDFEMSPTQIEAWLKDQQIQNTNRVRLVTLRGAASSFDILNPVCRRQWASRLRDLNADLVTVDCLRPAMDALGLDEHSDAGVWLTAFDELLKEAGVPEAVIVHHSGHGGDRSRGDSRILDWPDGIWSLVRENRDDLNSTRFLSAKGRDISVDEGELTFDPLTRHLTYSPKDRRTAGADKVMVAVLRAVSRSAKPMSIRDVKAAMVDSNFTRSSIETALKRGSDPTRGYLCRVEGAKGAHLHSITRVGEEFLADADAEPM
jgi:hypothetical protein